MPHFDARHAGDGLTRRRLITWGAAGALTAYLGPLGRATARGATPAGAPLVRSSYTGLVGQSFSVEGDSGAAAMVLQTVGDVAGARSNRALRGHEKAFVLDFEGPESPELAQRIRVLHHETLGDVELFVAPVGAPSGGRQGYEVVIDNSIEVPSDPPQAAPAPSAQSPAPSATPSAPATTTSAPAPRRAHPKRHRRKHAARRRHRLAARTHRRRRHTRPAS